MLKPATHNPLSPRSEHGITLVELLVAMTLSVVIIAGLIAILVVSLRQQSRITNQVQANRTGRTTLSKAIEELHSSCTGLNTLPIQAPSTTVSSPLAASNGVNLWFLSAYGNKTSGEAVIKEVVEHDINWTASKTSNTGLSLGTLKDYSFAATGGEGPNWTFPALNTANATAKVLGTNVVAPTSGAIFEYEKYNTSGELILEKAVPLTTTTAKTVANVRISFTQAPETGDTRHGRTTNLSDSVLLRYSPGETGTEAENTPCH
jgi:type II secretory pathway pseudopilin PulG